MICYKITIKNNEQLKEFHDFIKKSSNYYLGDIPRKHIKISTTLYIHVHNEEDNNEATSKIVFTKCLINQGKNNKCIAVKSFQEITNLILLKNI